jgi:hypothetical protein
MHPQRLAAQLHPVLKRSVTVCVWLLLWGGCVRWGRSIRCGPRHVFDKLALKLLPLGLMPRAEIKTYDGP